MPNGGKGPFCGAKLSQQGLPLKVAACFKVGMLLYRDNSLQTVQEKRKRIQAELAAAIPPDNVEDREEERNSETVHRIFWARVGGWEFQFPW